MAVVKKPKVGEASPLSAVRSGIAKKAPRVTGADKAPPGTRARQAQDTRQAILRAAVQVFAKDGFAGGRIEQISRLARSHDRMIYHYFGSKEKLFVAVLESIYAQLSDAERALELDVARPLEALRALIAFTWNYYLAHPEFITLLNSENLHRGRHARQSPNLGSISQVALSILEQILRRGQESGQFRANLRARDFYIMIASLGYFYNSNRFTLSAFLGENLMDRDALDYWQEFMTETILRTVCTSWPPAADPKALPPVTKAVSRIRR